MSAGMPIPPDLLFSIKRSYDSSLSTKLFSYQTSPLGWNPYHQLGYGKKIDPEPGRCRRTDGKKWRCSKEAYPDSKYCERHMHRGKNRSRKPVEVMASTTAEGGGGGATTVVNNNMNSGIHPSPMSSISSITKQHNTTPNPSGGGSIYFSSNVDNSPSLHSDMSTNNSTTAHYGRHYGTHQSDYQLLYPHSSSYSRTPGIGTQDAAAAAAQNMIFDSAGSFRDRYYHGVKEEVGEHDFLTGSSGSVKGFSGGSSIDDTPWQHNMNPLKMGTATTNSSLYQQSKQRSDYPYLELKSDNILKQQEKQNQECYVWGRDFQRELSMKVDDQDRENQGNQKTTHHFFDEWPPKGGRDHSPWHDSSTTQLSISIPTNNTTSHDFFLSNPKSHNDG